MKFLIFESFRFHRAKSRGCCAGAFPPLGGAIASSSSSSEPPLRGDVVSCVYTFIPLEGATIQRAGVVMHDALHCYAEKKLNKMVNSSNACLPVSHVTFPTILI